MTVFGSSVLKEVWQIAMSCRRTLNLSHAPEISVPSFINTINGEMYILVIEPDQEERIVWLLEKLKAEPILILNRKAESLMGKMG